MAIDPVCGMTVDEKTARFTAEYEGKTYYFCAKGCRDEFLANPQAYVGGADHGGHQHPGHMHGGHGHMMHGGHHCCGH